MANTLQSLFPFSTINPVRAKVHTVSMNFAAPIVAGEYVFDESTTPPQSLGTLPQEQTGIIAGLMIGANCTPEDFAANVVDSLKIDVLSAIDYNRVNSSPFPFSQFAQGDNYCIWWNITGTTDQRYEQEYLIKITGKVKQISNMSENQLKLKIAFNYLKVDNEELEAARKYIKDATSIAEFLKQKIGG